MSNASSRLFIFSHFFDFLFICINWHVQLRDYYAKFQLGALWKVLICKKVPTFSNAWKILFRYYEDLLSSFEEIWKSAWTGKMDFFNQVSNFSFYRYRIEISLPLTLSLTIGRHFKSQFSHYACIRILLSRQPLWHYFQTVTICLQSRYEISIKNRTRINYI